MVSIKKNNKKQGFVFGKRGMAMQEVGLRLWVVCSCFYHTTCGQSSRLRGESCSVQLRWWRGQQLGSKVRAPRAV